jgi:hypothetical protein
MSLALALTLVNSFCCLISFLDLVSAFTDGSLRLSGLLYPTVGLFLCKKFVFVLLEVPNVVHNIIKCVCLFPVDLEF